MQTKGKATQSFRILCSCCLQNTHFSLFSDVTFLLPFHICTGRAYLILKIPCSPFINEKVKQRSRWPLIVIYCHCQKSCASGLIVFCSSSSTFHALNSQNHHYLLHFKQHYLSSFHLLLFNIDNKALENRNFPWQLQKAIPPVKQLTGTFVLLSSVGYGLLLHGSVVVVLQGEEQGEKKPHKQWK